MLSNPDCTLTKEEIAASLGVGVETLYAWLRDPAFVAQTNSLSERYARAEIALVRKTVIAGCRNGDARAIKLYFDLLDRPEKTEEDETSLSPEDRAMLRACMELLQSKSSETEAGAEIKTP